MSDPTTETVSSIAAGVVAITLAVLGVHPQALVYAALGGFVGMSLAPNLGRWKAVITFGCVMCLCAAFGTWCAGYYHGNEVLRNIVAGGSALVFHPIFSVVVQRLPEAADGLMRRIGLKR